MKYTLIVILVSVPALLFGQSISGSWSTASSDGFSGRYGLTSVVVDGKIFAIAGHTNIGPCNIVEVYDPSTDSWNTPTTSGTLTARYELTASVVDGKIYVCGGSGSHGATNTLEEFDPVTNTWTTPTTTGNFTKRAWLSSSVFAKKIYVFGGTAGPYVDALNTLEVFDPSTSIWSTPSTTGTFTPRCGSSSVLIGDKIYVLGGFTQNNKYVVEIFDPINNLWSTPATNPPFPARMSSAACVIDGKIYLIGGEDDSGNAVDFFEIFDPSNNTWTSPVITSGAFEARQGLTAEFTGGKIFAMGGANNSESALITNQVFIPTPSAVPQRDFSDISLSPNPATGRFTIGNISSNVTKVLIMDVLGKTVGEVRNIRTSDISLDLSNLASGTYYVRFISPNSVITRILVKD
ncbi:MAG: kelch repeat-containing protein [Bacteroidota bacterium]|nr:kelch repeat-containing protein [Bacteroidota bacterium]MDP4236381.1 kelch repeat-containing protein [Bacteroidota bacterium]